jgi:hypothetical protein
MKRMNTLSILARRTKNTLVLLAITGFLTVHGAAAASLPELLEQGIYSEETKGDLDAAVKIYQQVVTEAKAGQAVAAQAQYRLGACLYKKKSFSEATVAFEKLVKDYPDQKELLVLANKYLAGAMLLLPEPWMDGEEMLLDIKFSTGFKLGMASYKVIAGELNGRKIWRVSSRLMAGAPSFSQVEVEADSFKPIHSRWKHGLIGDADTVYSSAMAEVKLKGKDEAKKVELDGPVFDNEEVIQLIRRLPLALNFTMTVRCFTSLGGGNIIPIKLNVTGVETLEVPAGKFECHKVEMSLITGKQTFWYSTDAHRYLVKFEAGGVAAELTAVQVRKPGEPVAFKDDGLGVSLTAPADWAFFRSDPLKGIDANFISVIDPEAIGTSTLTLSSGMVKSNLDEAKTVRNWAEQEIADGVKIGKNDGKMRSDGWTERTLDGHAAVSALSDREENKEQQVVYTVYAIINTKGIKFKFMIPSGDFERLKPTLDAIIDSFKMK